MMEDRNVHFYKLTILDLKLGSNTSHAKNYLI